MNPRIISWLEEKLKIPPEVAALFSDFDAEYECMDNFRAALVGDAEAEAEYDQIKESGCCGRYDQIVEVNGKSWHIGFNYGH